MNSFIMKAAGTAKNPKAYVVAMGCYTSSVIYSWENAVKLRDLVLKTENFDSIRIKIAMAMVDIRQIDSTKYIDKAIEKPE